MRYDAFVGLVCVLGLRLVWFGLVFFSLLFALLSALYVCSHTHIRNIVIYNVFYFLLPLFIYLLK